MVSVSVYGVTMLRADHHNDTVRLRIDSDGRAAVVLTLYDLEPDAADAYATAITATNQAMS